MSKPSPRPSPRRPALEVTPLPALPVPLPVWERELLLPELTRLLTAAPTPSEETTDATSS
jgi:hypothetical protein